MTMRHVRYSAAASLDGYIARPKGEYDWIIMDPAIDFAEFFKGFDAVLMGRRTYEVALAQGGGPAIPGMRSYVFSRTLRAADHPDVTMVAESADTVVAGLKQESGKDIWLMGGGVLFRSLLDARLVDTIEVGVMPVLVGRGIPLLEPGAYGTTLRLTESRALASGIMMLSYDIVY